RLHYSREVFEPDQGSVRARCEAAQFAPRPILYRHPATDAGQLARRGRDRSHARRCCAGFQRVARLFRQLSLRAATGEPAPGSTRLFRRAHLRARRQTRRVSHRVDGIGQATNPKSCGTERAGAAPRGRIREIAMPIYVYETTDPSKPVRRFELKQSMKDEPLRVDPKTGEPVRRVTSGGSGV